MFTKQQMEMRKGIGNGHNAPGNPISSMFFPSGFYRDTLWNAHFATLILSFRNITLSGSYYPKSVRYNSFRLYLTED